MTDPVTTGVQAVRQAGEAVAPRANTAPPVQPTPAAPGAPQTGTASTTSGLQSQGAPGALAQGTSEGAAQGQNTITSGPAQSAQGAAQADIQMRQRAEEQRIQTLYQLMGGLGNANIATAQNAEQTTTAIDAITRRAAANGQSWWSGVAGWVDGLDRFLGRTFNINLPESWTNWAREELQYANTYSAGDIQTTPIDPSLANTVTAVQERFDEGAAADAAAGVYRRPSVQPRIAPVVAGGGGSGGAAAPAAPAPVSLSAFLTAVRNDSTLEGPEKSALAREAAAFANLRGDPSTISAAEAELFAQSATVRGLDDAEKRNVARALTLEMQ